MSIPSLQSSQNFVRALKAPSDPPKAGDPTKIEIARQAWDTTSFRIPNKGETIVDWLLTRLLKDRTRDSALNPLLDVRYWQLLSDILCPSEELRQDAEYTRGVKAWLLPLLNRTPIVPVIASLLTVSEHLAASQKEQLYDLAAPSLAFMWPTAIQKATPDVLFDCFGALLRAVATDQDSSPEGLIKIAHLVVTAVRTAFSNSSNKKKLHQSFLQNHLTTWLHCVASAATSRDDAALSADVFSAGIDILFNTDSLKLLSEPTFPKEFADAVEGSVLSNPASALVALPKIFRSFSQAVKKSRSALFGHADGSLAEARLSAMRFFAFCQTLLGKLEEAQDDASWKARIALLQVVEEETLFSADQAEAEALLKNVVESCVVALENSTDETRRANIFGPLCVLVRIDHDLVDSFIPRVLPRVLADYDQLGDDTPSAFHPASQFLALVLTYHARTRTIPIHVSRILTSFLPPFSMSSSPDAAKMYANATTSPPLSRAYLEKITRAVRTYLTPGQALDATRQILEALQQSFDGYAEAVQAASADNGSGSRKKRRKSEQTSSSTPRADPDAWAISFSLTARFVSAILAALPVHSVTEPVQQEIRQAINAAVNGFVKSAVNPALEMTKSGKRERGDSGWAVQVVGAAALRFRYDVLAANELSVNAERDSAEENLMLQCLTTSDPLPELLVELARYLLRQTTYEGFPQHKELLDAILNILEREISVPSPDGVGWSGKSSALSTDKKGHAAAAVALLRLILDRWLSAIDDFGLPSQHERLSYLLLQACASESFGSRFGQTLCPSTVVYQSIHSAGFWEQSNIRASVLSAISSQTRDLNDVDVTQLLSQTPSSKTRQKARTKSSTLGTLTSKAVGAFTFLLYTPTEYLSRTLRTDLVRRAIAADVQLGYAEDGRSGKAAVRGLLHRLFAFFGSADSQVTRPYLQYLLQPSPPHSETSEDYTAITLDLIELHFQTLLNAAEKGADADLVAILKDLREVPLPSSPKPESSGSAASVPILSIARFVGILTSKYSKSAFQDATTLAIQALHDKLVRQVQPAVLSLAEPGRNGRDVFEGASVLELWRQCLILGTWLSSSPPELDLGRRVAHAIAAVTTSWHAPMSQETLRHISETSSVTLGILLAELQCVSNADRELQLGVIVATYALFSRCCDDAGRGSLDEHVRKVARTLSPEDFSFALGMILETLTGLGNAEIFPYLVSLSTILLHDAPDGTLKIVQDYLTRYLDTFVNIPIFLQGPVALRLKVLAFVNTHCSDRPASIRPINLMTIWSLISRFLSSSNSHDTETCYAIFYEIVSIISALVRLRRDLVLNTLPHLCIALRGLIRCLRSPRPQLGAKQHKLVTDTLPKWINAAQPLGSEESKALARLLTTLAVKSVIRTYSTRTELQKPESLARPLSKHVAYVIQAYVEAMDDPLCIVPSNVRRELQPGLFVLCDMLNEHGRDALMVSALHAGGKVIMKGLWGEYEKQRYVGRG